MPGSLPSFRRLFRLATGRRPLASDIDDELKFHLDLAEEEMVDAGLSPAEAQQRARSAFGDRAAITRTIADIDRSHHQAQRRGEFMDRWITDLRLAVRGLARDRWFAVNAIALVGLALGANIAVFSIFNAAFFRPLPYPAADRLVTVGETKRGRENRVASQNFLDWRRLSRDFSQLAAFQSWDAPLLIGERPEMASIAPVSNSFAAVMGVAPLAGRWFSAEESRVGGAPAVVIGERLWRNRFGADRAAIGAIVRIDGRPAPIVGVMPADLDFPVGADLWVPAEPSSDDNPNRSAHNWNVVGRLVDGAGLVEASRRLSIITQQLVAGEPGGSEFLADGAVVTPFRQALLGQSDRVIGLLQAAVGLLLLIAILNLTALLLARAAKRQSEVAMVMTLGASRRDLLRRFATESLLLAALGTVFGLGCWFLGRQALVGAVARLLPFVRSLPIDGRLMLGVVGATALVGLGSGLIPALWVARAVDRGTVRRDTQRVVGPGRLMQGILAAEVAATFVLLFGTALLAKSLDRMLEKPLGFATDDRVTMSVSLPNDDASGYLNPDRHRALFDELSRRVGALPGVLAVGVTTSMPIEGFSPNGSARIQGEPSDLGGPAAVSDFRVVGPGFFEAMGIPVLKGRTFSGQDTPTSPYVVVVSEAFAKIHLRGEDPIGRQVRFPGMDSFGEDRWATVVGVVGDTRHRGPGDRFEPAIYYDFRQRPQVYRAMTVVAHVSGLTRPVLSGMEEALASLEPAVPFVGGPFSSALAGAVAGPRVRTMVLGSFAAAALLLAGLGLFGVVGFVVLRRTRELGLRIALGAPSRAVAASAASHAAWPAAIGIGIGAIVSILLARAVRGFLFELSPTDPIAFLGAALAVVAAAVLASVGPVRRALRIDPAIALRSS